MTEIFLLMRRGVLTILSNSIMASRGLNVGLFENNHLKKASCDSAFAKSSTLKTPAYLVVFKK
jgi:hypothetical protein